jgi:hypothetical protein
VRPKGNNRRDHLAHLTQGARLARVTRGFSLTWDNLTLR